MEVLPTRDENDYKILNNENNNLYKANAADKRKCTACTKDIKPESFVSWEFMSFCDEACISKYQKTLPSQCSSCTSKIQEASFGKYYQRLKSCFALFCSKTCLVKYRSTVKICSFCERVKPEGGSSDWIILRLQVTCLLSAVTFCSHSCYKKFVEMTRSASHKIPANTTCTVCESTKSLTIVLENDRERNFFCSKKCLTAYSFVKLQSGAAECSMCKKYYTGNTLDDHRVYLDGADFRLCSYTCKNVFIFSRRKIVACTWCQSANYDTGMVISHSNAFSSLYFCSSNCLKKHQGTSVNLKKCRVILPKLPLTQLETTHIMKGVVSQRNVATMCSVQRASRGVQIGPIMLNKRLQTEDVARILLPVPVPLYVPTPMAMYAVPVPFPVPIPIPIPIPVFIPTSRNTAKGMMKEIEKVKCQVPTNPFEAELLNIAGVLSGSDANCGSDSEAEALAKAEDVKDMDICDGALANHFDLEWALPDSVTQIKSESVQRAKRPSEMSYVGGKKAKFEEISDSGEGFLNKTNDMRLDYSLGINAWKQWVSKTHCVKNTRVFKSEILEMAPEEFSHALCLFIKELRKPNGDEYAPDTIYYLCLGIQFYLEENGKVDNIFHNVIYEKFTDCLNELAMRFCALYDDESHFIVTRVEEEHLWETRQLGCHSPFVLLNTLVYFNTKYYCRSTVDEHMELSFYHVMKTNRKNSKSNSIALRFYPVSKSNSERVYEQREDPEDPLRCPVKLYEFYLSKCPEIVKNKFDMMYLKPEKHCASDSPLWYTAEPLPREALAKIVNRVKMVKEINVALLGNSN